MRRCSGTTGDGCGALIDPLKLNPPNPQAGADGSHLPSPEPNQPGSGSAFRRSP